MNDSATKAPKAKRSKKIQPSAIEAFTVLQQSAEAQDAQAAAVQDILDHTTPRPTEVEVALSEVGAILDGASPDDVAALKKVVMNWRQFGTKLPVSRDDELVEDWRSSSYPYKNRLSRKNYEQQKYHLQVELLKLQSWVRETGQRIVLLFEGRDAAGKGGAIKRFM